MARDNPISKVKSHPIIHWVSFADIILSGYVEPALIGAVKALARIPETVPMMNRIPTIVAVFLFVPWGLCLVVFIFYLLVVIDFGVNKPPTPVAVFL